MAGQRETQKSVFDWCEEHYPEDTKEQKLLNLLEEVAELGCVIGVSGDAMRRALDISIAKSGDPVGDETYIGKELGDVQLSVLNLAESLSMDADARMQQVMRENRKRTREESAARSARKRDMGLKA